MKDLGKYNIHKVQKKLLLRKDLHPLRKSQKQSLGQGQGQEQNLGQSQQKNL